MKPLPIIDLTSRIVRDKIRVTVSSPIIGRRINEGAVCKETDPRTGRENPLKMRAIIDRDRHVFRLGATPRPIHGSPRPIRARVRRERERRNRPEAPRPRPNRRSITKRTVGVLPSEVAIQTPAEGELGPKNVAREP